MSNLIVRKARKDYVCDCCGHVIAKGTEYLDDVVIKYGNVVHHKRYHDECPAKSAAEQLFKRIIDADGDLIVSTPSGDKWHIHGISYISGEANVHIGPWEGGTWRYATFEEIKDWIDEYGERILSKS